MDLETKKALKERLQCLSEVTNCRECGFPERHGVCTKNVAKVCLELLSEFEELEKNSILVKSSSDVVLCKDCRKNMICETTIGKPKDWYCADGVRLDK